jgi:hypothetical protein
MNWKFWKKTSVGGGAGSAMKPAKLDKPRDLPEPIGHKMVVGMKIEPDDVWALRYVSRPIEQRPGTVEFRLFDPDKARMAGVVIKGWSTLDDRPEFIRYTGRFTKSVKQVEMD